MSKLPPTPRHHNNKTRKLEIKESKWIGDEINPEEDRPRASRSAIRQDDLRFDEWCDDFWVHDDRWWMGLTISGFATIGDEWVWRFLGSWSKEWVRRRDLSLSLSLSLTVFVRLSPSFFCFLSLSLGIAQWTSSVLGFLGSSKLLDVDRSRLHRCWGASAISCPCCLSLSLLFSWDGSDLKWKWERKLFSAPLSLILRSNWKHFQFDRIFSNSQTSTFLKKHFWNQFETKTNGALVL